MIRVLIVDDFPVIRYAIRTILASAADVEVVGEAGNGQEAVALVDKLAPGVVIMDVVMPGMDGIQATQAINARHPNIAVLLVSMHAGSTVERNAVAKGARGYLAKDNLASHLVAAIRRIAGGDLYLIASSRYRRPASGSQPQRTAD
jgi:DNA-binding NarL/FixJ family response regulator